MTPPKDQAPGLVARINSCLLNFTGQADGPMGLLRDAADRITQLEGENAELRGKLDRTERLCDLVDSMGSDARHQRNAAETALRRIAEGNLGDAPWQANYERIREVARAALTEQANIRSPMQSQIK